MKPTICVAMVLAALSGGGCAYHGGSGDYRGYEVGAEQSVRFGVVETVRDVRINPRETGVGAASGAVLGSVAGSHLGRGSGEIVGVIAGAIVGSIIGSQIEDQANQRPGIEVTVRLDSGRYIAVVQEPDEAFRNGDRVRVLTGRGSTRVTH